MDVANRRRWFGGITLGAAMLMLLLGMTFLKTRLGEVAFLVYWTICLLLTAASMVVAFRDLKQLQQRTRDEQRDLVETTLRDIAQEARSRVRSQDKPKRPGA